MNVTINWSAGGGSSTQDVQYKLSSSAAWITQGSVTGTVVTYTINGLSDNLLYDFRVVSNCTGGTAVNSSLLQQINILCPSVTATTTASTVAYSFAAVGGSVSAYTVELLNSAGTTIIATQSSVSGTFTGLSEGTVYKIRVSAVAGSFTKVCNLVSATTTVTPVCNAPTINTVTLA